jgi:hypothetical protein
VDVDLNTILTAGDVEDTLGASLNWNVSLVRDVSDEIRRRISNAVFAGFQRRAPAREIAKEITEATGMARARARRIAADQTVKLGARLNQARQEQAGLTSFKWQAPSEKLAQAARRQGLSVAGEFHSRRRHAGSAALLWMHGRRRGNVRG